MTVTAKALRADGAESWRPYRTQHVIDLEWLAGAGGRPAAGGRQAWPSDELLRRTWMAYLQTIGIQHGDHALLGLRSGRCGRMADLLVASRVQLRVAPRVRGIPAALAESVDVRHAARRFDCLVVVGGASELAALAAGGRAAGLRVWQVGGPGPLVSGTGRPAPALSQAAA